MSEELNRHISNLSEALDFRERKLQAPADVRCAVGSDDIDWILDAAEKVVETWNRADQLPTTTL